MYKRKYISDTTITLITLIVFVLIGRFYLEVFTNNECYILAGILVAFSIAGFIERIAGALEAIKEMFEEDNL